MTRPDGTTAVHDHDYSTGCSGVITHTDPDDLGMLFQPGTNQVHVQFRNTCGGNASAMAAVRRETRASTPMRCGHHGVQARR